MFQKQYQIKKRNKTTYYKIKVIHIIARSSVIIRKDCSQWTITDVFQSFNLFYLYSMYVRLHTFTQGLIK